MNPVPLEEYRKEKINEITAFFHKDFTKHYATVISLTEEMPEQVNNEIRNAFTHLVRVNIVKTNPEIKDEAEKAICHTERACRDCMKACLIQSYENIERQYNYACAYHTNISPKLMTERKNIKKERKNIGLAEAAGERHLLGRFEDLVVRSLELQDNLQEQYGLRVENISWIKRMWLQLIAGGIMKAIGMAIYGIIVFLIGRYY